MNEGTGNVTKGLKYIREQYQDSTESIFLKRTVLRASAPFSSLFMYKKQTLWPRGWLNYNAQLTSPIPNSIVSAFVQANEINPAPLFVILKQDLSVSC